MELETIIESKVNGQHKQTIEYIRSYGVKKFFRDYIDYLKSNYSPGEERFNALCEMYTYYFGDE